MKINRSLLPEDQPITGDEFIRIHNIVDNATLARLAAEHHDDADHDDCFQPHRTADGYVDCDGRPL
ncbi:hypothetical protein [Streptomyces sparsogenes]|uniref:Uncharacterized protein n=1 Tax=Streptomyces sparsogenes DSM 40356 TaxID=1331668 RepID=A0A1R1S881_9ACTN|nr:hypothetical protein [Streptomyces sparsogenes]OMI34433.1 hypothetical protein SPAR_36656 [Streptomyces sparsogenes DSM 40356]